MRKIREVLRLRFELKLGYQPIGRSYAIAVSTVHKYLRRAEAAGIQWPLPKDWDEARVEAAVFPRSGFTPAAEKVVTRTPPDFGWWSRFANAATATPWADSAACAAPLWIPLRRE